MKQENRLITGTMFALMVSGVTSMALGSLIPFFRSTYQLSYESTGILVSAQSVGSFVAVGLMGYLPIFLGRRKSVLIMSAWMAVAYLLFTTGWGGAAVLPFLCFAMGCARGSNSNFANTMMSTLPGKKAGVGYNLVHGAYAAGSFAAPLLIVACTNGNPGGWRIATAILLGLCLLQLADYAIIPVSEDKAAKSVRSIDYSFLRNRAFWLSSGILFFYVSAEFAITGWLVTYFQDIGVLSDNLSQMMGSLLWCVMFIGRIAGAVIIGKVSRKLLLLVDGIGVTVFFLLVFFSRSELPIIIGIAGVGLFMATIYTAAMSIGTESIRGNDLGVSTMVLTGIAGGVITPAVVGFVAEHAGIRNGMGVVVAATVMLLIMILITISTEECGT